MEENISNTAIIVADNLNTNNSANTSENAADDKCNAHAAAKILDRPLETVRRWRKEGKLPAVKVGNVFLFLKSDVLKFKAELDAKKIAKNKDGTSAEIYLFSNDEGKKIMDIDKLDADEVKDDNGTIENAADDVSKEFLQDEIVDTSTLEKEVPASVPQNSLIVATSNTPPSLDTLTVEIKFYLQQTAQNIIAVGKRLIQAKELVSHGDWLNWLKENFSLSYRTAKNFMDCAKKFSNLQTSATLNYSQMVEMLALSEGDAEKFIAEKAAEGTPVEDMTTKNLREEVKHWKAQAEKVQTDSADEIARLEKVRSSLNDALNDNRNAIHELTVEKNKISAELNAAQKEIKELQEKPVDVAIEYPADYESNKKELAELKSRDKDFQNVFELFKTLEQLQNTIKVIDSANAKNLNAAIKYFIGKSDENSFLEMPRDLETIKRKLDDAYTMG